MTILGYSCGLQSSLYTKNHRFTLKALIFGPINFCRIYQKFIDKKGASDKSKKDINVGAPLLLKTLILFIENLSLMLGVDWTE
jgi:hypothetical protein